MDNIRLYTCMVGKKPTHANFYVNEVSEVEQTLARMAGTDGDAPPMQQQIQQQKGGLGGVVPGVVGVGGSAKGSARLEPPTEV